jgi:glycosyltransferase involved in cell wall biosynthesis
MRIILISGVPIVPVHEGNQSRILSLARAIREQGHDLWVALLPSGIWAEADRFAHTREFGADRVVELGVDGPLSRLRWLPFRLRRKLARQLGLPSGFYTGLDEHYRRRWSGQLARLHGEHRFDAAIVEYVLHSGALDAFPTDVRKLIDTHDSLADRHKPYLAQGMKGGYFFSLRPRDENRGFRRADAILAIQEEEAAIFHRQLGRDEGNPGVAVVSHILDLSTGPVSARDIPRALFLGSGNASNKLSARWFVDNVLPLILARLPDFRLVLAGSVCEAVEDHPAIEKLGRVERVIDAFERAPLLINPMVVGTGINIKILDALAAGVATVSTETGARGLPADFRGGMLLAPDRDYAAFAAHVVALMEDASRREMLGRRAREDAIRWNQRQNDALARVLRG